MSAPDELIAGRYRLVARLGSGGMGVVWEAWDERLERRVAVKQLHPVRGLSPAEAELANSRAMREARINARLHHRYAVPIFDVAEHDGQPCLVMQFVPSMPLSEVLREGGPLRPVEAARVGAEVGSALAAAHKVGIVHRDVKPGNILIADDGSALISDFGISQAMGDATLTQAGMVHGTPAYLAPEVARGGPASPASDVFSLGATLYAALEGSPPFGTDQNSIALLHRVATGEFAPPVRSGALTPLLLAMLATDPEARPPMAELARQLGSPATAAAVDPTLVLTTREPTPTATPTPTLLEPAAPTTPEPTPTPPPRPTPPPPTPEATIPTTVRPVVSPDSGTAAAETQPPPDPARRRRKALIAVAAVLVVALVASLISYAVFRPQTTTADPPVVTTPSEAVTPSAEVSSPPASSAAPTPTPSATPTPSPTPTSSSPSPTSKKPGEPTKAQLTGVISTYYSLVPDDTDAAWPLLTSSYQRSPSGGRTSYERFWGAISKVSVSNLSAKPPETATATVTYTFKDGRTSRERTRFRIVDDDGKLKIKGTTVVSGG